MGLLSLGTPLDWDQVKPYADHVREHGISQFLHIWNRIKTRRKDHLLWGDEIEYILVKFDHEKKQVFLDLTAPELLSSLQNLENEGIRKGTGFPSSWKVEYGKYMLEGTPGAPYGDTLEDLLLVEHNMQKRRELAVSLLQDGQCILSITNFPLLGSVLAPFASPHAEPTPDSGASQSLFVPDAVITSHARFPTLTANIRKRRGEKVAMNVPIFRDSNTPSPFLEPLPPSVAHLLQSKGEYIPASLPDYTSAALPDHIYMDCMCFGMGCSCLQVTFQACSVEEARHLYDQLAPIAPLMLALSAGAPIFRGYLADVDCRWDVIAGSVDDRTSEERGLRPLNNSKFRINKSRYDSISRFLSCGPMYSGGCCSSAGTKDLYKPEYNDLNVAMDEKIRDRLVQEGVDELLATHYAHLFIRDPLVVFRELLDQDDQASSDHFENIQSTNWQTMRFKPPPPSQPNMGWRVEFRSMEVQLTDHENAAFSIFVVLLVRTILLFNLNFYVPLSKVDDNMVRAQKRDAVRRERFWFRKTVVEDPTVAEKLRLPRTSFSDPNGNEASDEFKPMHLETIFNGDDDFLGLTTFVDMYLDSIEELEDVTRDTLKGYVNVIRQRASGERMTGARWMREFVHAHPAYKNDSIVSQEISYDLLRSIEKITPDDLLVKSK